MTHIIDDVDALLKDEAAFNAEKSKLTEAEIDARKAALAADRIALKTCYKPYLSRAVMSVTWDHHDGIYTQRIARPGNANFQHPEGGVIAFEKASTFFPEISVEEKAFGGRTDQRFFIVNIPGSVIAELGITPPLSQLSEPPRDTEKDTGIPVPRSAGTNWATKAMPLPTAAPTKTGTGGSTPQGAGSGTNAGGNGGYKGRTSGPSGTTPRR